MLQDAQLFLQDLNLEYLEEEFALNWEKDPSRLFKKGINAPQPEFSTGGEVPPTGSAPAKNIMSPGGLEKSMMETLKGGM